MSVSKKSIGGSIHRVREFKLEQVNLAEEFDILQIVGEGWFGKILLTEHKSTQTEMVLKALPKAYIPITDFYREFHYGLHLSPHRNIITTYDVAFETAGFYVFSQEYAPLGDLTSNVTETGLGELHSKRVARQLAAAVHHIHSRDLVHRDIKLDNILVFKSDFSRIKLCDFGETRKINTIVRRHNEWLPYSPPEVLQINTDETYKALTSHDIWQFGIVLFVCLTGCLPWQKAAMDDRRYTRYLNWHSATLNIAKKPKLFQLISSKAQRMFKRLLEPKLDKRPISVLEINKYLDDRWLGKLGAEKAQTGGAEERDELCPSMYSFHSSLEEKNQLLYTLTRFGIETTVDRSKKKDRIREWIQASAIIEENEDEESTSSILEEIDKLNETLELSDDDNNNKNNMKGKHFPERRPSIKIPKSSPERPITSENLKTTTTNNQHHHHHHHRHHHDNNEKLYKKTKSSHRPSLKNLERRNPFAPQVAREMQTIAKFANFPNGDPKLGINDLQPLRTVPVQNLNLINSTYNHQKYQQKNNDIMLNDSSSIAQGSSSGTNSIDYSDNPKLIVNYNNLNQIKIQQPLINNNNSFLTMPIASHLVMQSFNAIQTINTAQSQNFTSTVVVNDDHLKNKINDNNDTTVYGKDAYEHYGVAQGTVVRSESAKRQTGGGGGGSSRSGSRSVSN
ncbi:hypothetical protein HCN44_002907 [Aphidius gifuensis]|uniref:Protein kinase domain-containing protein n=1 Tax=Aphidius gifuensis TaxID=684658 RepID=A0A834XT01_APHGI|nr:serine/threonine-protein kinase meng-po-like [Aphidius gifuensis]XP_044010652.1 serine/threonine-protein kinase meng-po-like [Aphidius gifuensis]KAF7991345.1 hypothetical protein HCN44_002907 [Aphidius gifuensis]